MRLGKAWTKADEIDLMVAEAGDHLGVVVGALAAGGGDGDGGQAEVSGGGEAGGVFDVGEDYGYFGVVEAVILDRAVDGEEVRASAGEEDAEFLHWVRLILLRSHSYYAEPEAR